MNRTWYRHWSWIVVVVLILALPDPITPMDAAAPIVAESSILFVENVGQFDARARFQVRGAGVALWLTEDALWLTVTEPHPSSRLSDSVSQGEREGVRAVHLRLSFVGANPRPRLEPFGRRDVRVDYYLGNDPARWHTNVPVWSGVRYRDLYPGVDVEIAGEGDRWTWRVVTKDATRARNIRLQVNGAESADVAEGALRLNTAVGQIALPLLTFDQEEGGAPAVLNAADGSTQIVQPFAAAAPAGLGTLAVAYPEEAYFGTFLGGSDYDWAYDLALSGQGDILDRNMAVWVVGVTFSSNFPTEPPGGTTLRGSTDAFVTKIQRQATLVKPLYSAYIGGTDQDGAYSVATDASGNVYVTGYTRSTDLPTTVNAYDRSHNGYADAFVLKLDSLGNLLYATYLGGSHFTVPGGGEGGGDDGGRGIAVDASGKVYVIGQTSSEDLPTTPGAYDRVYANVDIGLGDDIFVAKLNPVGQGQADLLYSTFVGGGFWERGTDIAVDAAGVVYMTGTTGDKLSPQIPNDFPTTTGAYDRQAAANAPQAFFLRLNPAGNGASDLLYSTFLGGSDQEGTNGQAIALDGASQRVYICGRTGSPTFPTTAGALDTTCGSDGACNSRSDYFVSKLNPGGQSAADLLYSTYLGGNLFEGYLGPCDIAVGSNGDVYVTGDTSSTDLPVTADAFDSTPDSNWGEMFVVRLRPQGQGAADLIYGTYVGGSSWEGGDGAGITLDGQNRVYVFGTTSSYDFPVTDHAFDKTYSGKDDSVLFRILTPPTPDLSTSTKTVSPEQAGAGETVTYTVRLVNSGIISATVRFTDTLPAVLQLQGSPVSSSGPSPTVNGQSITWQGTVTNETTVVITYTAQLTETVAAVNQAQIDDGVGNIYLRQAFVNGWRVFLPLTLRNYGP